MSLLPVSSGVGGGAPRHPAIALSEFIFENAPFASCHASTIVDPGAGDLVAAWFGGTCEGESDVGVWVSRQENGRWTEPTEAANGLQIDGRRYPVWNPVLFQPQDGPLMLFYKVGPSPQSWWGIVRMSTDGGKTWGDARQLPKGILGPIKNKPLQLADGTIVAPSSTESIDRPSRWRVHFERSADGGRSWVATRPLNDGLQLGAIQPSLLVHRDGRLQAVGRTRHAKVFSAWSDDGGKTWGPMTLLNLPNPNAATDAQTLADGQHLLVFNDTSRDRTLLSVAMSRDGCEWRNVMRLEGGGGEFSYPAVIQARNGLVHLTYTWKRIRIRHVVLDSRRL